MLIVDHITMKMNRIRQEQNIIRAGILLFQLISAALSLLVSIL